MMETVTFKQLVTDNRAEILSYMEWQNYDLNDTVIPIIDLLKEHALMVLEKCYGKFHVEQSIVDELCADVFIYFPILAQQLAITRLIDGYGVVKDDVNTEERVRKEQLNSEVGQNSELTVGTSQSDTNNRNTQQKTTGTVKNENDVTNTQTGSTLITNSSTVEKTGGRTMNLGFTMPEQALPGETGNFPTDDQGTPTMSGAFAQSGAGSYTTSNPIAQSETSDQDVSNTSTGSNDTLQTNDITVADTGTDTRTVVNSGKDMSDSTTTTDSVNDITETVTQTQTNKQYAYEIKAFLETADSLVAFEIWQDHFDWIPGII